MTDPSTNRGACSPLWALTVAREFCIITVPVSGSRFSLDRRGLNRVMIAKIPLVLAPQPEEGYTVTSPLFPVHHMAAIAATASD